MIFSVNNPPAKKKIRFNIGFPASLVVFLLLSFCSVGQIKDNLPLWSKTEKYSIYKVDTCKRLYHIVFKKDANYGDYDFCGWLQKETDDYYQFIKITGSQSRFRKKIVEKIVPCENNADILLHIEKNDDHFFYCGQTILPYVIVAAWAHKNNNDKLAMQLAEKAKEKKLDAASVRDYMAYMYYNNMLSAYSFHRDYKEATLYGDHLGGKGFEGFEYRNNAIALAKQLRSRTADFKMFTMPDSAQWLQISAKMSRKEQVLYLVDKIHLLNCFQNSQPGDIYYDDAQAIISSDSINTLSGNDWTMRGNYPAINPFNEIIRMKPTPNEVELIVPALLDTSFIPSFSFHRNFKCGRTLHKYSWVINELIFRITNMRFIDKFDFDKLDLGDKKKVTGDIIIWCRANNGLTEKERLHKILTESTIWEEFRKALQISVDNRDSSITDILAQRVGKYAFMGWSMPSYDGIMASVMFELSSGKDRDNQAILGWQNNVKDEWVRFWSTMFLLKFDKPNEELHLSTLAALLEKCDSTSSVYPYAMNILFSKDDFKARKVAEATLNGRRVYNMLNNWSNRDLLKLLIVNRCDEVFRSLYNGLNNFEEQPEYAMIFNGKEINNIKCDPYIRAVENWRSPGFNYQQEWSMKERKKYAHELSEWLATQYDLIKANKESAIKLDTLYMKTITTESFLLR